MNTNSVRLFTLQGNNKPQLNKNTICSQKSKTSIVKPVVKISTGSQALNKTVSESSDAGTTSVKEKYVFVIINNVASATAQDDALRILDIKSAISDGSSSLGNVSVQNVTFSADQVRSTISEVIENLPDKQNIDSNSSEIEHEYLLVLNCSIPFQVNQVSLENPFVLPTISTRRSSIDFSQATSHISRCEAGQEALNHHPGQSGLTLTENNVPYKIRSRLTASKATVKQFKEVPPEHPTCNEIREEPESSFGKENYILVKDDVYILVVDEGCDKTDVDQRSVRTEDDNGVQQMEITNNCSEVIGVVSNNTHNRGADFESCEKQYFCKVCKKSFNSVKYLRQHSVRKRCGNRRKTMNLKKQGVRRSKKTRREINNSKQPIMENNVTCAKCKDVFENGKMLKQHIKTTCNKVKEANRKSKICEICGKVYSKNHLFQAHMDAHANLRQVKCSECPSAFNNRKFLVKHIAQVHMKSKYMYVCSYCGLKSESKEHIEMHEQVHTLPEGVKVPQPYRCSCGKSFISKHLLRCHKYSYVCLYNDNNRKELSRKCPLCSKILASALSLNVHLKGIHNVNPKRGGKAINCDQCDKKYSWFGSYVRHKLVTHKAEVTAREVEPYVGQPVSEEFFQTKRPSSQKRPKEPTGPHVCDVCDKECKSRRALYAHKYIKHSEKRKNKLEFTGSVSCDLCHRAFSHKHSLGSHYHRYHRPRDPSQLTCLTCNKTFNDYGGLWTHNKYMHVDAPPFECNVCGSKFKRKGDHTRHLKDKHGIISKREDNSK